uniref:Uncharacterized protein n=1 Tax=Anguilla anguilla TaxID=7936 RepID=A0A0E9SU71_ANGAN
MDLRSVILMQILNTPGLLIRFDDVLVFQFEFSCKFN